MRRDVAIVGCGRMGRQRARAALGLGARVVALHDEDVARADELAALAPGSTVVKDWRDLDFAALDAVFVCTPPHARGPVELAALDAGVPVFVEKPLALSAPHTDALHDVLRRTSVITAVGYMNRYRPSVVRARDALHGRAVLGMSASWAGGRYAVPRWADDARSGGPINEQATHLVDLARYLVGDIREVHAIADERGGPAATTEAIAVTLRFASGGLGSLFYSCQAPQKWINLQVFGESAHVFLDGWDFRLRQDDGRLFPDVPADRDEIFTIEVAAFFDALRTGSRDSIRSDVLDAIETQRAVDAIRRSLVSHRIEVA